MSTPRTSARDAAIKIVSILQEAGHVAYFAGGCVRDRLLGLTPKDYDVATDATPDQVCKLFHRTRLVGEAFGVALVRIGGNDIEVATFRLEWGYTDGRRPDEVKFTDAEHDAQRRDFTINGLFEDPLADKIIDFVEGQADLKAGVIRAIGDPDQRFAEDYLRMLRAPRFAARLGFEIETRTARAITNHARYLGQISRERIGLEVQAMLQQPREKRKLAVQLLSQLQLDSPTLNEDHTDAPTPIFDALHDAADYGTTLAAWLLDRHPDRYDRMLTRWRKALCLSNESRDQCAKTLRLAEKSKQWQQLNIAQRKRLLADPRWQQAHYLIEAVESVGAFGDSFSDTFGELQQDAPKLFEEGVAPEQLVGGETLIDLGLKPSPVFKELLSDVYDQQLMGKVQTRDQAIEFLKGRLTTDETGNSHYNSPPDV